MTPLGKVDSIIRERKLAVQGILNWSPQFLVQRLYTACCVALYDVIYVASRISDASCIV